MGRFLKGLAVFALLLVAAALAVIFNPPTGWINQRAIQIVKATTGHDIEIKGPTSLHYRPFLMLRLNDVVVRNPPGMPSGELLHADTVDYAPSVSFSQWMWPSLGPGNVRVIAPKLQLTVNDQGQSNWQQSRVPVSGAPGGSQSEQLMLGQIVLSKASISYADAVSGQNLHLNDVTARFVQPKPEAPIDASFEAVLNNERVDVKALLPPLKQMMAGAPARSIVTMKAGPGRADIDATYDQGKGVIAGTGKIDVPALDKLAAWLGLDAATFGNGPMSFVGDIAIQPAAPPAAAAEPATKPQTETPGSLGRVQNASPGWQLAIHNGKFTAAGARDALPVKLEKIEASTTVGALSAPLTAVADLTWNGERVEATATLQSPEAISRRVKSGVTARISSKQDYIEVKGDLYPGQAATFLGRGKAATPSLRTLAERAGFAGQLPVDEGLEAVEIEGDLSLSSRNLRLWNARFAIDDSTARGNLALDGSGPRWVIGGRLAVDRVDTGRYLSGVVDPTSRPASAASGPPSASPGVSQVAASTPARNPFALELVPLTETLRAELRRLETGSAAQEAVTEAPGSGSAWSNEPVALDKLKVVDLDIDLSVDSLKVGRRTLAIPQLKALLADGRLSLDGKDIATHGGKISATAEIDASSPTPALKTRLVAEGVEVDQIFADFGLSPYLAGKAAVTADLTATGNSQRAVVSSLSGSLKASAERGALVGWDLGSTWGSIVDRFWRGLGMAPYSSVARTPIDQLQADIKIDKGVVEATGAQARGPQFAAVAEGRARLLVQQAEYRGTFSTFVAPQLEVPFRAAGPWTSARPALDPERGGALRVLLSLIGFTRSSSGASLESVGSDDRELEDLARQYAAKLQSTGNLSREDAEAAQKLQDLLGPATR